MFPAPDEPGPGAPTPLPPPDPALSGKPPLCVEFDQHMRIATQATRDWAFARWNELDWLGRERLLHELERRRLDGTL